MNIDNIVKTILEVCGALAVLSGGIGGVVYMLSPFRNLKKRVDAIEDKLDSDYNRMDNIEEKLDDVDETAKHTCKAIVQLLNHEITGNGVDKLKESKEELEDFLIQK